MKYYLETNALRALGSKMHKKEEILLKSFTSIFSIFEIIKGIDRSKDSYKRLQIIKNLTKTNLKMINMMPIEFIENTFLDKVDISESYEINKALEIFINSNFDKYEKSNSYLHIVEKYEENTKKFKEIMTKDSCISKPQEKTIKITLDDLLSEPKLSSELLEKIAKLPKNSHPSEVFLLTIEDEYAISIYKGLNISNKISDNDILQAYTGELNLFFFALYAFELKKKSLREATAKNDLLDLLHTVYLCNTDMIMVSDDKIFKTILPNKNIISVEEYKNL